MNTTMLIEGGQPIEAADPELADFLEGLPMVDETMREHRQFTQADLIDLDNDTIKEGALHAINPVRMMVLNEPPLEELPTGCISGNWRTCLVGRCFPGNPDVAIGVAHADPFVSELEARFERGRMPEHEA